MIIAIAGGPHTGKTTLATELAQVYGITDVRHTDDLIGSSYRWSQVSEIVASWFDGPGDRVIEGTRVVHGLRKWHEQHPGEPPPVDIFRFLTDLHAPSDARQTAMAKGIAKIYDEISAWLAPANLTPVK